MLVQTHGICVRRQKGAGPFHLLILVKERKGASVGCYGLSDWISVLGCGHVCAALISRCCECWKGSSERGPRSCLVCEIREKARGVK